MFWHKDKLTKAERVERALRSAGMAGISNWDLNRITFRYGVTIFNLRNQGYDIQTVKIGSDGLYKYYWKGK